MPKKCETCRHHGTIDRGPKRILVPGLVDRSRNSLVELCSNHVLASDEIKEMFPDRHGLPLDYARNLCDREGDGIFVYYEPKRTWKDCPDCGHTVFSDEIHECRTRKGAAFGESRAEFERDRQGQTGHDNAAKMAAAGGVR